MFQGIELQDLTISFGKDAAAVDHLSIVFQENCITGVIGESGSGKSLMAMAILQLLPPAAKIQGRVLLQGKDLLQLDFESMRKIKGKVIGLIPQNPADSMNPSLCIQDQIHEVLREHTSMDKNQRKAAIQDLLYRFGFEDPTSIMKSYPFQLSGGMKQRALCAFGAAAKPPWIIADEPTKGLDALLRRQVYNLLLQIAEEDTKSMIIITHDISLANIVCQRLLVLYKGHVLEIGTAQDILRRSLHPYTNALIDCMPSRGLKEMKTLRENIPGACPYLDKCPLARKRCFEEKPPFRTLEGKHGVRCFYA